MIIAIMIIIGCWIWLVRTPRMSRIRKMIMSNCDKVCSRNTFVGLHQSNVLAQARIGKLIKGFIKYSMQVLGIFTLWIEMLEKKGEKKKSERKQHSYESKENKM
jgi:hypothetical protein